MSDDGAAVVWNEKSWLMDRHHPQDKSWDASPNDVSLIVCAVVVDQFRPTGVRKVVPVSTVLP